MSGKQKLEECACNLSIKEAETVGSLYSLSLVEPTCLAN